MRQELLPDTLVRLWADVEGGRLSREEFHRDQDVFLEEYRDEWKRALLLDGEADLPNSILRELASYFGDGDLDETRRLCLDAVADIKGEWRDKVGSIDADRVRSFYDQSRAMLHELMWWHTLTDDLSPLAYVVALKFASMHGCGNCLDFGSGVGSGALLFVRNGITVTLADISSKALGFSAWRFARRGLEARQIDLKSQKLPAAFDFITAMDVFEHLVDPVGTVRDLHAALKTGGYLFGRFHAELDELRPHHIVLDFEPTFKELEKLGFTRVWQDRWLWGHEVYQKL
ncbi:MAG: class I SAM-dependent methyltransferase [Syntrophobacteraceae bacterium]